MIIGNPFTYEVEAWVPLQVKERVYDAAGGSVTGFVRKS
jgi:hypothetical protein